MDATRCATPATQSGPSAERSTVLIAANPYSGTGPTRARVDALVVALERHGLEPRVVWDAAERSALLRQPEIDRWCACVIVAGGDGTVADVINEQPRQVPLAALPVGNENLFAREFGFCGDPQRLARAIASGRTRQIDLGCAGGRLFSLMASVGADADVVHRLSRWRVMEGCLKRVSRLSYVKPILATLRSYPYSRIELEADGRQVVGTHCLVFNLAQYGFQLKFAPCAAGDDGLLDWVVFEGPGLCRAATYLWAVLTSKHLERPDVRYGRARSLRVTSSFPVPVQADGDPVGFTPVEIEVVPQALRVLAMEEGSGCGTLAGEKGQGRW